MKLPWYWRSLPLNQQTGADVFEKLFFKDSVATLLESPFPTPKDYPYLSRYSICAGSPRQMETPILGRIFPFLQSLLSDLPEINREIDHLPFVGGWLGWLGYDFAQEIEQLPQYLPDTLPFPVAYWYQPQNFAILDHYDQRLWLAVTEEGTLDQLEKQLESDANSIERVTDSALYPLRFVSSQKDYEASVRQAKQYIKAGDIFQANLSLRFQTQTKANSWSIYRHLQQINPSPFASYWRSHWEM